MFALAGRCVRSFSRSKALAHSPFQQRQQHAKSLMTKAVVLEQIKEINIRDIDVEEPFTADDVRIDIKSVGICGSDVHYYQHGSIGPFVLRQPMILGHECSGVVTQVGDNVSHLNVGDRVCMEPGIPDPTSKATLMGMYNVDPKVRFWATPPAHPDLLANPAWAAGHGCLRPSVIHPASFTFKIADNISFDQAAMVEPLAVGMWACTKAQIQPGSTCAVIGAGPIGMMTAISALASGCARVLIADLSQEKLKVAEQLVAPGRIKGICVKDRDLSETVKQETDGWGADVVMECSGSHQGAKATADLGCPGGTVVFVGCQGHPCPLDVDSMQVKEITTQSIFRYRNMYPKCIALLESGSIDLSPIITDTFSFDQSIEAFDYMCDPLDSTIKSIIRVSE